MNQYKLVSKFITVAIFVIVIALGASRAFSVGVSDPQPVPFYLRAAPATDMTESSATLNGSASVTKLATAWNVSESQLRYWFQYSKNQSAGGAGSTSTSVVTIPIGTTTVQKAISNLESNQLYYYRLCATDYLGHAACGNSTMSFTASTPSPTAPACVDTGGDDRSYMISQADAMEETTELVNLNNPEVSLGNYTISGATGTICGWEAIVLVSPTNPFPLITNIKITTHGIPFALADQQIDATTFQSNGTFYYAWFFFPSTVPIHEGETKLIKITGSTGTTKGIVTIGIGGISHQPPGASVASLPVFDKVLFVRNSF